MAQGPAKEVTGQQTMANSEPVVIASDQTPVPVTGPLTDAELRATPVPVSGTLTAVTTDSTSTVNSYDDIAAIRANLEQLLLSQDKLEQAPLYTQELNPFSRDSSGNIIISDGPNVILGSGRSVNDVLCVFDTSGYKVACMQLLASSFLTIQASNDQITWTTINVFTTAGGTANSGVALTGGAIGNSGLYITHCVGKYIRIVCASTSAAFSTAKVVLKNIDLPWEFALNGIGININNVSSVSPSPGTTISTGAASTQSGSLGVGGQQAPGSTTVLYPVVVGGRETPTPSALAGRVRTLLTDTEGRIITSPQTPLGLTDPELAPLLLRDFQDIMQPIADSLEQLAKSQDDYEQTPIGIKGNVNISNNPNIGIGGYSDNAKFINTPVTQEGHLEVALHDPRLPFGSIHTERLTPIFQADAVYGLNTGQVSYGSTLTGSVAATDSNFVVSTGATIYAQANLQSVKRLRYRAGQGVVGRFAGSYTSPADSSYQVIGFGHAEDGIYFGYKDKNFGILYVNRGAREVRTLTITVASSNTENVTVTLNGTAFLVAVTNSANIQRTVYEISKGTYTGWYAYPSGATIVFVSDAAGALAGAFTLAGTSATGTFATTRVGVAGTESFIKQVEWNGDTFDGSKSARNPSGIRLNPLKGNVYQIGIQYLGYGSIRCQIEAVPLNNNNPEFITAHIIQLPNTLSTTSLRNPCFPFTMAVYSAGSTTDLTCKVGSFGGFIEGEKILHGNRSCFTNNLTTVTPAAYQALFTIINPSYYGSIASQVVVNLLSISGALKHTSPCIYYLIKNGTLVGNPNFAAFSSTSACLWDTAATSVTFSTNDQILWTGHLGDTGEIDHHFGGTGDMNMEELTLQPNETITLAAKSLVGTPAWVTGSIITREDQ